MNELETLLVSVRAVIESCELNSESDEDDMFIRGWSAAHRKIGAFLKGSLDRLCLDETGNTSLCNGEPSC